MTQCQFTYEQMKEAGWSDESLLANEEYAHLVPKPQAPPPPGEVPTPPAPVEELVPPPMETSPPAPVEAPPPFVDNEVFPPPIEETQTPPLPQEEQELPMTGAVPTEGADVTDITPAPTFTPQVEQTAIIGNITPANFDNMMKVLSVISKENPTDNIIIRDSKVCQNTANCIIEADMTKALGQPMNLDIINSNRYVKLFSQFRNDNNIFIVDDEQNKRFMVTNGEIRLFLPKQEQQTTQTASSVDITNSQKVCSKVIDKETRKIIKALAKDQEYVEFLIQENQLKAMHIPNTAVFVFSDYLADTNANKLDETNAELVLRSNSFLPVEADGYDVSILKLADGTYASITDCKIGGQIDVKVMELCDNTTGGNVLL